MLGLKSSVVIGGGSSVGTTRNWSVNDTNGFVDTDPTGIVNIALGTALVYVTAIAVNNASSVVVTGGPAVYMKLSATAATAVNLTGRTFTDLHLIVGNPATFGMPTVNNSVVFVSTTKTALVLFGNLQVSLTLTTPAMMTVTLPNVTNTFAGLAVVGAALNQATVDALLVNCDSNGHPSAGIFDTSGGTSAAPTIDVAASAAEINYTAPIASALATTGTGSWIRFCGQTFWGDNGVTTAPGDNIGSEYAADITVAVTGAEVATAFAAAMDAQGFAASAVGTSVQAVFDTTGPQSASTQIAGDPFSVTLETLGSNAHNAAKQSLVAKGWTVTTN